VASDVERRLLRATTMIITTAINTIATTKIATTLTQTAMMIVVRESLSGDERNLSDTIL
jgi:hypothetical protein